jgi:signal transduction histidine kinase
MSPAAPPAHRPLHDLPDVPEGDAAAAWARDIRRKLLRGATVTVSICTAIAAVLSVIDRGGFGFKLVYSLAIGMSCWATIDIGRLLVGQAIDRVRLRRGLPPFAHDSPLRWVGLVAACAVALPIGPWLGYAIADAVVGLFGPRRAYLDNALTMQVSLAMTVAGTAIAVLVLVLFERNVRLRTQAQVAQREAAEQRLKLLEAQLEPHMLFNTLANLRILIGTDPPRAQQMLDRLNGFLRATLGGSRAAWHPLADEFERLRDYLALMAIRMGPRLQVTLDLPDELRQVPVPPLLLQPLVENAIRHGLEPKVGAGRLSVTARREGTRLVLAVRDTGVGLDAAAAAPAGDRTSFGLEQVRARLQTLYGTTASLALCAAEPDEDGPDGGTLAVVTLPLERRP